MRNRRFISLFVAALVVAFAVPADAQDRQAMVKRGAYLVDGLGACGNCHTKRGPDQFSMSTGYLAGGEEFGGGPAPFHSHARNITPDVNTGIGSWTSEQIVRAIREGVSKEGEVLGPPMPYELYNKMSDDDAMAIAAYLKTVKPVHNEVRQSKFKFPLRAGHPAKGRKAPPRSDKLAYGEYLVAMAHCLECHTPVVKGRRNFATQMGAGGFPFPVGPGKFIKSRNITPDKETGIGSWTDDQVKRAIVKGIDKDGEKLIPIMPYPYLEKMTAADLDAIVAYLRTIPAIKNKIPANPTLKSVQR